MKALKFITLFGLILFSIYLIYTCVVADREGILPSDVMFHHSIHQQANQLKHLTEDYDRLLEVRPRTRFTRFTCTSLVEDLKGLENLPAKQDKCVQKIGVILSKIDTSEIKYLRETEKTDLLHAQTIVEVQKDIDSLYKIDMFYINNRIFDPPVPAPGDPEGYITP